MSDSELDDGEIVSDSAETDGEGGSSVTTGSEEYSPVLNKISGEERILVGIKRKAVSVENDSKKQKPRVDEREFEKKTTSSQKKFAGKTGVTLNPEEK